MRINFFVVFFMNVFKRYFYQIFIKNKIIIFYLNEYFKLKFLNILKLNNLTRVSSLMDIVVIDHIKSFNRFEITYSFWSHLYCIRFFVKLFLNAHIGLCSIGQFFKSAIWLEREIWDMYGIKFFLHGDLRRILTDYGFYGFPLRKDFPLIGYTELRYEHSLQSIVTDFIENSQGFRFFRFKNPWVNWK